MEFELRIGIDYNSWLRTFLTNCKVRLAGVDLAQKQSLINYSSPFSYQFSLHFRFL